VNEQELARYQEWIKEKWKHGPCPVCKTSNWRVADNPGMLPADVPASVLGPFPFVLVYCSNCGYTLFINSLVAGIKSV
jgi:hypothetical protein